MTAPPKALAQCHAAAAHLATPISYPGGCGPYFELEGEGIPYGLVHQLGETMSLELHGISAELASLLLAVIRHPQAAQFVALAKQEFPPEHFWNTLTQPPVSVPVQNYPDVSGE